ncbi:DNA-J related domain-containing protein [Flocculibacter collagenilyticus]|uniref:DNA-J related domain-containing protein n=1 Tax=Flocculibacter collagenilyticus TaxID=2744479 RepID=UPI0018F5D1DF|nr:DNA-J related domain-containing protein [Flocculibacter collagenilyticus]
MHSEILISCLEDYLSFNYGDHQEFDVIKALQQPPYNIFAVDALSGSEQLFKTHFVLYNALYLLADRWRASEFATIELALTKITVKEYQKVTNDVEQSTMHKLIEKNSVRSFYLDWENFSLTKADIDDLLSQFWQKFYRYSNNQEWLSNTDLHNADLNLLGLSVPISQRDLKANYKKLAHQHHPDKNGDAELFKQIQSAYVRTLKRVSFSNHFTS